MNEATAAGESYVSLRISLSSRRESATWGSATPVTGGGTEYSEGTGNARRSEGSGDGGVNVGICCCDRVNECTEEMRNLTTSTGGSSVCRSGVGR